MFRTYDNNLRIGPLGNEIPGLKPSRAFKEILSDTIAAVHVGPPFWSQDDRSLQGSRP